MPRTLSLGSTGNDVVELQRNLNQLPSKQLQLKPDGQFGGKTRTRVVEVQSNAGLKADGVVGPLTWGKVIELLRQIGEGGIPIVEGLPPDAFAHMRPLIMLVAQQCIGKVDFSIMINGKPKGIEFLIEMFQFAAHVKLTEDSFHPLIWGQRKENSLLRKVPNRAVWQWTPRVGDDWEGKNWCGIFAVYCHRKAGIPVIWDLQKGKPVGRVELAEKGPINIDAIRMADIGCVATKNHHFLIESVTRSGKSAGITSIDGNGFFGRIERSIKHRVGVDNFNYYSLT